MFTFSSAVFEVLWEALNLPPMPGRLAIDQHGATTGERQRFRDVASAEAERLGLGRPPHIEPRLAELFDILARHDRALSLRELAGHSRRAYVAAQGRHGARAIVHRDQISLRPASGDHLVNELIDLLPPMPAGPGRAVTLPSTAFGDAMAAYTDPTESTAARRILSVAGVNGKDVERLLTIGREATSSGSIGVHRDVLVGSIAYTDTAQGRYAIIRRTGHDGRSHTSIAPADADWLRRRLLTLTTA